MSRQPYMYTMSNKKIPKKVLNYLGGFLDSGQPKTTLRRFEEEQWNSNQANNDSNAHMTEWMSLEQVSKNKKQ